MIALLLDTGMRHGEITALRWDDLNFEKNTVHIHRTVSLLKRGHTEGKAKTEAGEREITLSPSVIAALQEHSLRQTAIQQRAGSAWRGLNLVFPTTKGGYLYKTSNSHKFYRLLSQAGLPQIHIHELRYTAVTLMMEMGINQKAIQHRVGHAQMKMTLKYTRVSAAMQEEIAVRLDRLLWGSEPSF
jgi:integrase